MQEKRSVVWRERFVSANRLTGSPLLPPQTFPFKQVEFVLHPSPLNFSTFSAACDTSINDILPRCFRWGGACVEVEFRFRIHPGEPKASVDFYTPASIAVIENLLLLTY